MIIGTDDKDIANHNEMATLLIIYAYFTTITPEIFIENQPMLLHYNPYDYNIIII